MAFRVELAPQAFEDIDTIAAYISDKSSSTVAERWFNGIIKTIASLRDMPATCAVATESDELGKEIRVLLHGKKKHAFKIYFALESESKSAGTVHVFHIRHWARKQLGGSELREMIGELGESN
jgi:plasmid stabilization system protein ParE